MADLGTSRRARIALGVFLALALAVTLAWTAWAYYLGGSSSLGPEQPLPFSHRVHVTDKGIDCRFCHAYPDRAPYAGLPPEQTCMFCHRSVITQHEPIRKLWGYYERGSRFPGCGCSRCRTTCTSATACTCAKSWTVRTATATWRPRTVFSRRRSC